MEVGFEVSYAQAVSSVKVHFLLPADQDVELMAPSPELCMPVCQHALHHDNGPLKL